jgi:hypothetical protein
MANTATTAAAATNSTPTVGEELFLIHLRRESAASTAEIHKHQALVGQELWEVHCQRSRGDNAVEDMDVGEQTPTLKVGKTGSKGNTKKATSTPAVRTKTQSKPAAAAVSRYNLRSKDAAMTKE